MACTEGLGMLELDMRAQELGMSGSRTSFVLSGFDKENTPRAENTQGMSTSEQVAVVQCTEVSERVQQLKSGEP